MVHGIISPPFDAGTASSCAMDAPLPLKKMWPDHDVSVMCTTAQ